MRAHPQPVETLPVETLEAMERMAVELAALAGAEITAALTRTLSVRYKTSAPGAETHRDPVSEVDHEVERRVRERLSEAFPEHDIIGEEMDERPGRDHDTVWAIDPLDGTTNFINGFPLFAGSIGVLHRGYPVAGAIWCSTSHALRPGVYHARAGGPLHFDGATVERQARPLVKRRLVGMPDARPDADLRHDIRKTGSAAVECAFIAAGLLQAARFSTPNIWDVAAGVVLVQAAGGEVHIGGPDGWARFQRFEAAPDPAGTLDLRRWRRAMVLGEAGAVAELAALR